MEGLEGFSPQKILKIRVDFLHLLSGLESKEKGVSWVFRRDPESETDLIPLQLEAFLISLISSLRSCSYFYIFFLPFLQPIRAKA